MLLDGLGDYVESQELSFTRPLTIDSDTPTTSIVSLVMGDATEIAVTLTRANLPFAIYEGQEVTAALVDISGTTYLTSAYLVPRNYPGSGWASSLIVLRIEGAEYSGACILTRATL